MKEMQTDFEKSKTKLSVTLFNSGIIKDGEHVGKVSRTVVSLENLIAGIIEENSGIDPLLIQHSAFLLKKQILKMLSQGKAVNLLDIGTVYIGLKGTVKGNNPKSSDLSELKLNFTPSSEAKESLKNVAIDKVVFSDNAPKIQSITDLWTKSINSQITMGKTCIIKGRKLKLGGNSYSISFIKLDKTGKADLSSAPVIVDESKITKNTNGVLQFFVPESLDKNAFYKIRISTSYINKYKSRKNPLVKESIKVKVIE